MNEPILKEFRKKHNILGYQEELRAIQSTESFE